MKPNVIEIETLPGGMVKITSGKVSPAIHGKIEEALRKLHAGLGSKPVKTTHLPHAHRGMAAHTHVNGQKHQ